MSRQVGRLLQRFARRFTIKPGQKSRTEIGILGAGCLGAGFLGTMRFAVIQAPTLSSDRVPARDDSGYGCNSRATFA